MLNDFSKLVNDPIYKELVKDWNYAMLVKNDAVAKEYTAWKRVIEMEKQFKLDNNIND